MDPAQPENESQNETQLERSKRKEPKGFNTDFEVFRELVNPVKKKYSLKLVKPATEGSVGTTNYPSVCFMEESVSNKHAFDIMHNLNHKNILSLKLLAEMETKGEESPSVAAFVELYDGKLWSILGPAECVDDVGHIPSRKLQNFLRDIVIAVDFIRMNGRYHGNLSWKSTLYFAGMVKLAGFKVNDSEDPHWNDWLCFIAMLEKVSQWVRDSNVFCSSQCFTGNIDSLIAHLKTLDRTSLLTIKQIILEDPFFWSALERAEFFTHEVSLKLSDQHFLQSVSGSSICQKSWDKNGTYDFQNLVNKMNDYRDAEEKKRGGYKEAARKKGAKKRGVKKNGADEKGIHYDGDSLEDYVKCICGAYTHWKQIKASGHTV